jgi:hypothetical protein
MKYASGNKALISNKCWAGNLLWWGRPIASVLYESQELPTLILTLHKAALRKFS